MAVPIFHVDAFTTEPFAGNPAAVCLLDEPREDAWMHAVAAEMNLSETAFVSRVEDGFSLRWMTPTVEVDLCGHATLATALVLWEHGWLARGATARFHTRSGVLTAEPGDRGLIWLDFPELPFVPGPVPEVVPHALGAAPVATGTCGARWFVELSTEAEVRALSPDFARLRSIPGRALIVTAAADAGSPLDCVSRFFAPWIGIDEDPVTGSAHCCIGPYWSARLGRPTIEAWQASARGGRLRVVSSGDRVRIGGHAVMVTRGTLL
jgi:PhzF family phenazine biosynthesis protein